MLFEKPKRTDEPKEEIAEEGGERIHTMPKEFRNGVKRKFGNNNNKKTPFFIWIIVIALVLGGAGFYFWQKWQQSKQVAPSFKKEAAPPGSQPEKKLSKAQTVRAEIKRDDVIASWAELYIPEGALEKDVIVEMTSNPAPLGTSMNGYKVVAGFFNVSPSDLVFSKPAVLKIFYKEEQVEKRWENDLTLGYVKDETLTPINSTLDAEGNVLSLELNFFPASSFALVIEESKTIPGGEEMIISPETPSSSDGDQDGLTDVEETLYSTNKNNPDTDGDGVADGKEIINLTNPNSKEEGSVILSGLVSVYTDPVFNYSFFYPAGWIAKAIPETDNTEMMITTNTNEFFNITIVDNKGKLSPLEWYKKESPGAETALEETLIGGIPALFSPDRLTVYLSHEDRIYAFSYKIGLEKEANFKTTFKMMLKSWQFIEREQAHPDNTLIKYPDSGVVYLIEQGKKRAFKSGEIFEALGYKWENVIEIPVDETYPNGPEISSSATSSPQT